MALKLIKAWVAISPNIAKETILSKIINTVHMFSIDVADKNFDDTQKKYIDTILKLDDSKTIMLETKWESISVKNMTPILFEKDQTIYLEYSSILEDDTNSLFINYWHIDDISIGAVLTFSHSTVQLKLIDKSNELYKLICISWWELSKGQKVFFENYNQKTSFLSERDKKNIIRWIQSGVNVLSAWSIKKVTDVEDIRKFLIQNNGQGMKLYARLSQKMVLRWVEDIVDIVDGVVIHHDDRNTNEQEDAFILNVKNNWKPLIIVLNDNDIQNEDKTEQQLQRYIKLWVDVVAVSESFLNKTDIPLEHIQRVFSELDRIESHTEMLPIVRHISYRDDNKINENNYIIDLLPQIVHDTEAKIILCYSTYGHTAAKISSLGMNIPLLIFTRDDFSYRYNNLLRGVKWYKIWQTSTYEMFKQISKEMIRIYFKWNISLDDKVLIVNIFEDEKEKLMDGLINGIELYKFKNI